MEGLFEKLGSRFLGGFPGAPHKRINKSPVGRPPGRAGKPSDANTKGFKVEYALTAVLLPCTSLTGDPYPLCSGFGIWDCRLFDVRKPLQFLPDGTTIVEIVSVSATPYRCEVKREGAHAAASSLFHLPTR